MEHIIKPINIDEILDLEPLYQHFEGIRKLFMLTGVKSVGKTAFLVKLLHGLSEKRHNDFDPVIFSFDQTIKYWQEKIEESAESKKYEFTKKIKVEYPIKEKSLPIAWPDIYLGISNVIRKVNSNFVVVDGIDQLEDKRGIDGLLCTFADLVLYGNVSHVIMTSRVPLIFPEFKLLKLEENNLIVRMSLTRPPFLGRKIKEFGDTVLNVK